MSLFHDSAIVGASGQGGAAGYQISRSLRFNSSDSAYLSRTPASAGNRKTWTWAGWVKRSGGNEPGIFSSYAGSNPSTTLYFNVDNRLVFYDYNSVYRINLLTTQVFRDFSAWYHIVVAVNTTAATSADRVKIYVNGLQITAFDTATYPALDWETNWNSVKEHNIGKHVNYQEGYLADIHFIDGQALTPSSFTEVSATTGQLVPKQYSGSFGTNGFWLKFSDNSAATATTLGKDYSGNNNNWSPTNLSVTAGAGNDSLVDTPTSYGTGNSGGDVRGNFCTANPLKTNSGVGFSNGNLDLDATTGGWFSCYSTFGITSGKWYWEATMTTNTSSALNAIALGICPDDTNILSNYVGATSDSYGLFSNGNKVNSASQVSYGSSFSAGDIAMVAFDDDSGKIWFGKNGTWFASGDPAAGTNAAYTSISATKTWIPVFSFDRGRFYCNFGQRPFAYTAPSGFKALVDTNIPVVIAKPSTVMDVKLYTGNDSTQSISLGFSPDFLWFKSRSTASQHALYDIIRGASKSLVSNSTASEATEGGGLATFDSAGFSLSGDNTIQGSTNGSGRSYVVWAWDAGTTTSSNGSGSITSQVRANASAGFSIVSYTAAYTGSARTVGHGLGVKPNLIILKNRNDGSANWRVYHSASGASLPLVLNSTAAASANIGIWNNTEPTSSVFTIGVNTDVGGNIGSGEGLIAYCFAPVAGYSSFGSYVGNGSSDGVFQWCGFRPRWIMIKNASSAGWDWSIRDTSRDPYNPTQQRLWANTSAAESTNDPYDILSNGFKLRISYGDFNASGNTYVWAAFAESPFQYARAR